jgi:GNAT superfamily N-acetyltransferase
MRLFIIRPADRNDTNRIREIIFEVLLEYGLSPDEQGKDSDLNDIDESYFNRGGYFGVVNDLNNKIVGTFGLYRVSNQIYELRKMYLLKEARGMGCGKLILNFAIQMAKEANIVLIQLETISVLKEAISLYKKFGFIETKPKEINDRVDQSFELTVNK